MSDFLNKDQLVDYVLTRKVYRTPDYLTADWVNDHIGLWGGLNNRWPETKGRYIRVLAQSSNYFFQPRIVEIMETVGRQGDWDAMMAKTGQLQTLQLTLGRLSKDQRFASRIAGLERRWGATLH